MRDHTYDPGCQETRDLLPDLMRGRLGGAALERAERHVAACAACARELAMLREARAVIHAGAPRLDTEAVAAAVRAATVRPTYPGERDPRPSIVPPRTAAPARRRVRRGVAAFAASALVVLGAGVLWQRSGTPGSDDGRGVRPGAPAVASSVPARGAATASPSGPGFAGGSRYPIREPRPSDLPALTLAAAGSGLGERFDDLSDEELQAVVAAVETSDRGLPDAEPEGELVPGEGG